MDKAKRPVIVVFHRDSASAARRCSQLTFNGWQTQQVFEEVEALAAVRRGDVCLVVLHMPVADAAGMDLPAVLRRIAGRSYLPIVVLTDSLAERDRCHFFNCGADEVISADVSDAEMIARVRVLLRIGEMQDNLAASHDALEAALDRERALLDEARRERDHLRELSYTDPLTHVQNVRAFRELIEHEFHMAKRYNHPVSLLMLDVDHFKIINDTHGHPSGDYILKELAVILRKSVRESDVVARIGGEEFCVLLPHADRSQAEKFARRIRKDVFRRKFTVYGKDIHITVSVGVATFPLDVETTDAGMLVDFADQALLEAKESGRDRVVAFGTLDAAVRRRHRMHYLNLPPYRYNLPMPFDGAASIEAGQREPAAGVCSSDKAQEIGAEK